MSEFMFWYGVALALFGIWALWDSSKRLKRSSENWRKAAAEHRQWASEIDAILSSNPEPPKDQTHE